MLDEHLFESIIMYVSQERYVLRRWCNRKAAAIVQGGLCVGSGPVSPRVVSPNPVDNNMLAPHHMQHARISPLSKCHPCYSFLVDVVLHRLSAITFVVTLEGTCLSYLNANYEI